MHQTWRVNDNSTYPARFRRGAWPGQLRGRRFCRIAWLSPPRRRRIHRALKALVPGLNHPRASEHQLDSVVCALTALLWRRGRTRSVGLPEEGLMTIPDVAVLRTGWRAILGP